MGEAFARAPNGPAGHAALTAKPHGVPAAPGGAAAQHYPGLMGAGLVVADYREQLRALADALPAEGGVTIPVAWLRGLLAGSGQPSVPTVEKMLNAVEVSRLLGTTERWVYSHANQLGGKRLSRRCLRFPESGIRRRIERRQ